MADVTGSGKSTELVLTDGHMFNVFFPTKTWVSRHQKGRINLDFNEARDDGVAVASGGPYASHLHLTPDR